MSGPATPVTLADVRAARDRIAAAIMRTPCPESRPLSSARLGTRAAMSSLRIVTMRPPSP